MHQYKLISRKGEGTFSEVLKAQSIKTGNYVAIKCMKTHFTSVEQVNQLREIQALRKVSPHPNIIKLLEILYDEPTGRLALVFELMEMNMYELIKDRKTYLPQGKIKNMMFQLFKSIEFMHRKGIFHRDIKPENILISGDLVKLADLGSCRGTLGEHPYTEYISTRWYRSPECLMTDGYYDQKMDIWGAGCVMYEIMTLVPLFPGKNELDMIHRIHNIIGTPSQKVLDRFKSHASHLDFNFPAKTGSGLDKMLAHVSPDCLDLLKQMLIYDPEKRITADQVLQHEYFRELVDQERQSDFYNTLNSARFSPSYRHLKQSLVSVDSDKLSNLYPEKTYGGEKGYYQQGGGQKKKMNKLKGIYGNTTKYPSITKPTLYNESSTEEDGERVSILPPLKHQSSSTQFDNKMMMMSSGVKKNDMKKLANLALKPTLSNQYLNKKHQKINSLQQPEYLVVGRKAS